MNACVSEGITTDDTHLRVAIASSGLGHVTRGMEVWAETLAADLAGRGVKVTLFRGAGPIKNDYDIVIPCFKRMGTVSQVGRLLNLFGGWRVGLGSPAQVESFSYGLGLLRHLRRGYDVVHIKQGSLGLFLNRAARLNLFNAPVILSNGQFAQPEFLNRFEYVQHLSPYEAERTCREGADKCCSFVVPNLVDTVKFQPRNKAKAREQIGLPQDAFIVLTVGAIKKYHKRMDYFVSEMSALRKLRDRKFHFLVVGAEDAETPGLRTYGESLLGDSLSIFTDMPNEDMPLLYNAVDVFTLCSLREAFGTVFIEAMASGIPVICNSFPVTQWIAGDGGKCVDMQQQGSLAQALVVLIDDREKCAAMGAAGRERVLREFSKEVVTSKMIEMYREVIGRSPYLSNKLQT